MFALLAHHQPPIAQPALESLAVATVVVHLHGDVMHPADPDAAVIKAGEFTALDVPLQEVDSAEFRQQGLHVDHPRRRFGQGIKLAVAAAGQATDHPGPLLPAVAVQIGVQPFTQTRLGLQRRDPDDGIGGQGVGAEQLFVGPQIQEPPRAVDPVGVVLAAAHHTKVAAVDPYRPAPGAQGEGQGHQFVGGPETAAGQHAGQAAAPGTVVRPARCR